MSGKVSAKRPQRLEILLICANWYNCQLQLSAYLKLRSINSIYALYANGVRLYKLASKHAKQEIVVLIVKFGKLIRLVCCYALEQLNAHCDQISMSFLMCKTFFSYSHQLDFLYCCYSLSTKILYCYYYVLNC